MSTFTFSIVPPAKQAPASVESKFDNVKGEWWMLPLSDAVTQGLFDASSHVCLYIEHCHDCRFPCFFAV